MKSSTRVFLTAGVLALAAVAGCRGDRSAERPRQFLPDMDDSPKMKPQTATPFFADGRSMRQPVANTVAFGLTAEANHPSRAEQLKADTGFYQGKDEAGKYVGVIPGSYTVDMKALSRGQERFGIYCAVCHGYDGKGKGTVGEQWNTPVANLLDPKYSDATQDLGRDGYIYHTIRYGLPADDPKQPMRMPAYGHAINESDAWAIVAYVRVLQAQQAGTPADLTPAAREALEKSRAAEIEKVKAARAALAAPPPAPAAAPVNPSGTPAKPEVK